MVLPNLKTLVKKVFEVNVYKTCKILVVLKMGDM